MNTNQTQIVTHTTKPPSFIKPTKNNLKKYGRSSAHHPNPIVNPHRPSPQTAQTGANYARQHNRSLPLSHYMETHNSKPFCILAEQYGEWLNFHVQPGMYFGYDGRAYYVARPHDTTVKKVFNLNPKQKPKQKPTEAFLYEFTGMPVYRISESGEWICSSENTELTRSLHKITLNRLKDGTFPKWNRRQNEKIPFQASRPRY